MIYPTITAVPERGGWSIYRHDSRDERVRVAWVAGKRAEVAAEVERLRAEIAAKRPVVCATCRRETLPGLIEDDECPACNAARYAPKDKERTGSIPGR